MIEVQEFKDKWATRVCIKVVDGVAVCWSNCKTIEEAKSATSVTTWGKWRELQPEEPAADQPKEITIDGVEYTLTPKTK